MPFNHSNRYTELTEEQFLLIGKIVVEFSNIDFLVRNLLTRLLLTSDFLGKTYLDNLFVSKTQEMIENALEIHSRRYGNKIIGEDQVLEIKSLNGRIKNIRGNRNKFAHHLWLRNDDQTIFGTKLPGKIPKGNKPDKDDTTITVTEMMKLYKEAYSIVEDLNKVIQTLPEITEQDLIDRFSK